MKRKLSELIKTNYENFFLSIVFVLCFASLAFIPLKLNSFSSFFHKASFVFVFIWFITAFIIDLVTKRFSLFKKDLICFILCGSIILFTCLSLLIDGCINHVNFSYAYFTKPILFFETIIFSLLCLKSKFTKMPFTLLKFLCVILSLLLLFLFVLGPGRVWAGTAKWQLLTLNYPNPNTASLVVTVLSALLIYFMFTSKVLLEKILFAIIIVGLVVLNVLTSCRNGIGAIAVLVVFSVLFQVLKKRRKGLATIVTCLPVLIMAAYFIIFVVINKGQFYIDDATAIKSFGTRFKIWCEGLKLINYIPFVGNYNYVFNKYGTYHFHNCYLDVAVSYGLIVFALTLIYYWFLIDRSIGLLKGSSKHHVMCFGIFACLFSLGTFEATPFYSPNGLAIIVLSIIGLARISIGESVFAEEGVKIEKNKTSDVLLITNVYGTGSIGKIVQDLHLKYLSKDIKSYVIYGRNRSIHHIDKNVACVESLLEVRLCQFINRLFKTQSFGYLFMTNEIIASIKHLKPKVVHIHALNDDFVNYKILLSYLSKHSIKTVFTNHSEYMFIGNCGGHSYGCNRFKTSGCYECPRKGLLSKHNAHKEYFKKLNLINTFDVANTAVTSVSSWLNSECMKSEIFRDFNHYIVLNGTRFAEYTFNNKIASPYHMMDSIKVVLFVSPSLTNPNKGFNYFKKLATLNKKNKTIKFVAITLDDFNEDTPSNLKIINNVKNSELLAKYYRFASVLVTTSRRETYCMPLAESLCCGTRVIGFKSGGPESICLKDFCEFVPFGNISKLNKVLLKVLKFQDNKNEIAEEARNKYSVSTMSETYLNVYKSIGVKLNKK